jgi:hypothetical protein
MDASGAPRDGSATAGPPAWAIPLIAAGPVIAWRGTFASEFARSASAPAWLASNAFIWACVTFTVAGVLVETGFYGMLWAARGRRLPFVATALVLLQLSMQEPVALWIREHGPTDPAAQIWRTLLIGARARWPGAAPGGFAAAFGSCGALTVLRVALSAWTQSSGTGRPWREAMAVVAGVWFASHLALGWLLDLMWGRSAMR